MAPTPVPLPDGFDVGKALSHAWKTLKPILEWTSTIVDKGYMMSDFLISKRQKGVDARYKFGKAEAEAYKILEAQQRDRQGKGAVEKRGFGGMSGTESDFREFIEWLVDEQQEERSK
jgi:hypothetical protein